MCDRRSVNYCMLGARSAWGFFQIAYDRRPADDSLFAAACGYRESRRCVGPRGLGERRKIHYNVKDFSRRRGINTMTANEASAARK